MTDNIIERLLEMLVGTSHTPAEAGKLLGELRATLGSGSSERGLALLDALAQRGIIITGDGNIIGDNNVALVIKGANEAAINTFLQQLRQRAAEDRDAETKLRIAEYLAAVGNYCANPPYLTLDHFKIRQPGTLTALYVPLRAHAQPGQTPPSKDTEKPADRPRPASISIAEVMRKAAPQHVLILGAPGAGKSTLLYQLAENAWRAPDKVGLDRRHLPILAPLRLLGSVDGSLETRLARAVHSTLSLLLRRDLPQGFFEEWPRQKDTPWLLLLDALDEVPVSMRSELLRQLQGFTKALGLHRVVITSRPASYTRGELAADLFSSYDLLPFTPEQTIEFAQRSFGDQGSRFLDELERVHTSGVRERPLLLTIAAGIYQRRGALPQSRSELYRQFVQISLGEAQLLMEKAESRGQKAELDERSRDVMLPALARLALAMTRQPSVEVPDEAIPIIAAYVRTELKLKNDEAETVGTRLLEVMARRSGVLTRHGDTYAFIHSTFREYLAAYALIEEWDATDVRIAAWSFIGKYWRDESWLEVIRFSLGLLADRSERLDTDHPVKRTLLRAVQYVPDAVYRQSESRRRQVGWLLALGALALLLVLGWSIGWQTMLFGVLLSMPILLVPLLLIVNILKQRPMDGDQLEKRDLEQRKQSTMAILLLGAVGNQAEDKTIRELLERLAHDIRLDDALRVI